MIRVKLRQGVGIRVGFLKEVSLRLNLNDANEQPCEVPGLLIRCTPQVALPLSASNACLSMQLSWLLVARELLECLLLDSLYHSTHHMALKLPARFSCPPSPH